MHSSFNLFNKRGPGAQASDPRVWLTQIQHLNQMFTFATNADVPGIRRKPGMATHAAIVAQCQVTCREVHELIQIEDRVWCDIDRIEALLTTNSGTRRSQREIQAQFERERDVVHYSTPASWAIVPAAHDSAFVFWRSARWVTQGSTVQRCDCYTSQSTTASEYATVG